MFVGDLKFAFRTQHAVRHFAPNVTGFQIDAGAGDMGSGGREHTCHAGAGIRRATHDLHRLSGARIDAADTQPIRVRMLFRFDHLGDRKRFQRRPVVDLLDFEPDHGQGVEDLFQCRFGFKMLFEPGKREFHRKGPKSS